MEEGGHHLEHQQQGEQQPEQQNTGSDEEVDHFYSIIRSNSEVRDYFRNR